MYVYLCCVVTVLRSHSTRYLTRLIPVLLHFEMFQIQRVGCLDFGSLRLSWDCPGIVPRLTLDGLNAFKHTYL